MGTPQLAQVSLWGWERWEGLALRKPGEKGRMWEGGEGERRGNGKGREGQDLPFRAEKHVLLIQRVEIHFDDGEGEVADVLLTWCRADAGIRLSVGPIPKIQGERKGRRETNNSSKSASVKRMRTSDSIAVSTSKTGAVSTLCDGDRMAKNLTAIRKGDIDALPLPQSLSIFS